MTLTALKSCGEWDVAARTFSELPGTFEKMVMNYLNILWPHLYGLFVESHAERDTMKRLQLTDHVFKEYPCARYATDVTFQMMSMPSGTRKERADYYSANHKQHGFKVEVSVLPNGMALN
ncbi:hypothetical protein PHYSODRAFT_327904 [Phytophthora sojae]|uniref:DDE Tnp4 domain-containing protein n=1 Tax=Phytophthora sojae (strain P6497) TaxID=1094619 RepID=G4Z851_PHYSP|nr:hypothetical protein PHYSODRAFT_327904 [Phytophthora sojae]EGZ19706.1 hypothetical protein PHYSODRAFT_327904 [Phytophthora sojae]|eukprot:XP_009522423.1 hypothetical protein PHYSODRAFT_327904 [Phytophthora sojae]